MSNGAENTIKQVEIIASTIGQYNSAHKSFVIPGQICVHPGDIVEFAAIETDAKLLFPNKNILHSKHHAQELENDFIDIESGNSCSIRISSEVEPGAYSFAVITTANNDLASGGSFPRFIVE